jgi:thiamine-monophosphate kinase
MADGLAEASQTFGVELIGGDTTRSPGPKFLSITMGGLCLQEPITRDKAKPDDLLYVTGTLGLAASGYAMSSPFDAALQALRRPSPPLEFALESAGEGLIHAMMDLSDGLHSDLPRLCEASGVGACVYRDQLPSHPELDQCPDALAYKLSGGDDYQLLFTSPPESQAALKACARKHSIQLKAIGIITKASDIQLSGEQWPDPTFRHFHGNAPCA